MNYKKKLNKKFIYFIILIIMTDNIDPYLLEINYIINKNDNKITKYVFNKVKKNRNSIWNGQWFLFQLKKILLDFVINDKEHKKEIEQMISNNEILLFLEKNNYIKLKKNIYELESKIELNDENDIIKYGFDKNLVPNGKIDIYGNIVTINSSIFFIPLTEEIIEEKDEEKVEKKINKKPKKPRIKAEKEEKKNIEEDNKARKKAEEKAIIKAEKEKEKARKKAEKEQTRKFKKIKKKFKKEKFNENFVNLWVTLNSIFDDYKSPNEYQIKDLFSMMKKATENKNEKDKYLFNENWRQEDAGEFLNTLFDILNDNIQHNNKIINTLKNIDSIECDGYKNTYPINYLNKLRIPNKFLNQNKELSEIINEVTNEEVEVNYDNCNNGKAIKNTIYQTVGDYLIVELIKYDKLQRINDDKIKIKISDTINIKDENNKNIKFNLIGTINHLGVNMNLGHYTSYIKKNTNEYEWYHCDDNKIKGHTRDEIFTFMKTNKPYIIFYERENIKKNGSRNRKPFGINNYGNTCFCNAVLQNLFNLNEFKNLVTKLPKKKEGKKCDEDKIDECSKKGKVCNEKTGRCNKESINNKKKVEKEDKDFKEKKSAKQSLKEGGNLVTVLNFENTIDDRINRLKYVHVVDVDFEKIPFIKNLEKMVLGSGDGYGSSQINNSDGTRNDENNPNVKEYWEWQRYNIHCCKEGYDTGKIIKNLEWIHKHKLYENIIICLVDIYDIKQCEKLSNVFKNQLTSIITDEHRLFLNIRFVRKMLKSKGTARVESIEDFLIDIDENKLQSWYVVPETLYQRHILAHIQKEKHLDIKSLLMQFRNCVEQILQDKTIMKNDALTWGYFNWEGDQLIVKASLKMIKMFESILPNMDNECIKYFNSQFKPEYQYYDGWGFQYQNNQRYKYFKICIVEPNDFILTKSSFGSVKKNIYTKKAEKEEYPEDFKEVKGKCDKTKKNKCNNKHKVCNEVTGRCINKKCEDKKEANAAKDKAKKEANAAREAKKKAKLEEVAKKKAECKKKKMIYDSKTKDCRERKRRGKKPKKDLSPKKDLMPKKNEKPKPKAKNKKCDEDKIDECSKKGKVCNEETGRCKEKKEKKSEIAFKSSPRSKWPFFLLSNFYGGSEFTYMSQRTTNSNLKKLYLKLRDMDMNYESFKNYRIKLQPSSKNKYEKPTYKDPYYYKDEDGTVFIGTGLIAKLISGSYKQEKRLKIVNEIAVRLDLEGNIKKEDFIDGTLKDKKKWMMNALKLKFKDSFYEDILLKTNNSDIYELKSGRDKNSMWAGKTGLLGKLLIKVRKNLKQKGVKGGNLPSWYNDLIKFI